MKDYNLDRILIPAFKLFMTHNYEKVSTSLLEKETGLTRGAIFYKLRTKEDIFKAVVDRFIIELQSANVSVGDSLIDFIDRYLKRINERMAHLIDLKLNNIHRAYFNLIYQALQFYPGFDKRITYIFQENLENWKQVIQIAIDNREIKPSCNVEMIAQQFRYVYSGLSFESSILSGLNVEELQKIYYSIYNEIKYEK
ncbi:MULTISPECIES: TetR/AcrR family transcriptional regulator [Bacteroidaceae]|uniref:TetR/AcrR family transcriptional regulator n=1 Tax=Bacteroidaceae TaxID=815 RepID=UPI003DA46E2F